MNPYREQYTQILNSLGIYTMKDFDEKWYLVDPVTKHRVYNLVTKAKLYDMEET